MNTKKLVDLQFRINLCKFCIKTLEEVPDSEPLKASALEHYKEQLATLESRLPSKPPPTVIGLKTATLSAKIPK